MHSRCTPIFPNLEAAPSVSDTTFHPRQQFRILNVSLTQGTFACDIAHDVAVHLGGSGLAAAIFSQHGCMDQPARHPDQPLIFAIGPLTGRFPMMTKVVCGFMSPYHGQYTESHAGGRLGMCMARAGWDAIELRGVAEGPVMLRIDPEGCRVVPAPELAGLDTFATEHAVKARLGADAQRASICCIGPAAETGCTYACATVDTYRHFGRMGAGRALALKGVKAIAVVGERRVSKPATAEYKAAFARLSSECATSQATSKYRGPGTAGIVESINALGALPWRNLEDSRDTGAEHISGEAFLRDICVSKRSCAGCTAACIHLGRVTTPYNGAPTDPQSISYDYEHIFALGSMLGITDPHAVMGLILSVERQGLDIMSTGGCLAWATEATEQGLISATQTVVPLAFGNAPAYAEAIAMLGCAYNEFYRVLGRGAAHAAAVYGGGDFACVLGQEMSGYATGEVFFAAQALNFRHSHLDNLCYCYDYEHFERDAKAAVDVLMADERRRTLVNCMVGCMFGRKIYTADVFADCMRLLGYDATADSLDVAADAVQRHRWTLRLQSGYDPRTVRIPKRFSKVVTARGPVDPAYMDAVRHTYAAAILDMGGGVPQPSAAAESAAEELV